jgi:hypothetical protein
MCATGINGQKHFCILFWVGQLDGVAQPVFHCLEHSGHVLAPLQHSGLATFHLLSKRLQHLCCSWYEAPIKIGHSEEGLQVASVARLWGNFLMASTLDEMGLMPAAEMRWPK